MVKVTKNIIDGVLIIAWIVGSYAFSVHMFAEQIERATRVSHQ